MEISETFCGSSKFPCSRERISSKFVYSLGTRAQKRSPALLYRQLEENDWSLGFQLVVEQEVRWKKGVSKPRGDISFCGRRWHGRRVDDMTALLNGAQDVKKMYVLNGNKRICFSALNKF